MAALYASRWSAVGCMDVTTKKNDLTQAGLLMVRHPEDDVRSMRLPDHPEPPPLTQITFVACCGHYPGGPTGADGYAIARSRWVLPSRLGVSRKSAGSAAILALSRPAQASHALRPARSLAHPKWTLSRGF